MGGTCSLDSKQSQSQFQSTEQSQIFQHYSENIKSESNQQVRDFEQSQNKFKKQKDIMNHEIFQHILIQNTGRSNEEYVQKFINDQGHEKILENINNQDFDQLKNNLLKSVQQCNKQNIQNKINNSYDSVKTENLLKTVQQKVKQNFQNTIQNTINNQKNSDQHYESKNYSCQTNYDQYEFKINSSYASVKQTPSVSDLTENSLVHVLNNYDSAIYSQERYENNLKLITIREINKSAEKDNKSAEKCNNYINIEQESQKYISDSQNYDQIYSLDYPEKFDNNIGDNILNNENYFSFNREKNMLFNRQLSQQLDEYKDNDLINLNKQTSFYQLSIGNSIDIENQFSSNRFNKKQKLDYNGTPCQQNDDFINLNKQSSDCISINDSSFIRNFDLQNQFSSNRFNEETNYHKNQIKYLQMKYISLTDDKLKSQLYDQIIELKQKLTIQMKILSEESDVEKNDSQFQNQDSQLSNQTFKQDENLNNQTINVQDDKICSIKKIYKKENLIQLNTNIEKINYKLDVTQNLLDQCMQVNNDIFSDQQNKVKIDSPYLKISSAYKKQIGKENSPQLTKNQQKIENNKSQSSDFKIFFQISTKKNKFLNINNSQQIIKNKKQKYNE